MLTHIESWAALVAVAIAFLQVFNPAATSCDLQKAIELGMLVTQQQRTYPVLNPM